MPRGYDRPLCILPFDHRGSFQSKMFGFAPPLSDAQTARVADASACPGEVGSGSPIKDMRQHKNQQRFPVTTDGQRSTMDGKRCKLVIYEGLRSTLAAGVPKERAGIPVDEQFGAAILRGTTADGITTACPAENSGSEIARRDRRLVDLFDAANTRQVVAFDQVSSS